MLDQHFCQKGLIDGIAVRAADHVAAAGPELLREPSGARVRSFQLIKASGDAQRMRLKTHQSSASVSLPTRMDHDFGRLPSCIWAQVGREHTPKT